jgi:hypothetical protein
MSICLVYALIASVTKIAHYISGIDEGRKIDVLPVD